MSAEAAGEGGKRAGWVAYGLALLLIVFGVAHDMPPVWRLMTDATSPTLGYRPLFNCAGTDGTCAVPALDNRGAPAVKPGSPLDRAGLKPGDRVRFDRPYDNLRAPHAGETIGLTIIHGGAVRHVTVTAERGEGLPTTVFSVFLVYYGSGLLCLAVGAFIILRSGRRIPPLLAGVAFVCFSTNGFCDLWQSWPAEWPWWQAIDMTVYIAPAYAFLAFAVFFREGVVPGVGRSGRVVLAAACASGLISMAVYMAYLFRAQAFPVVGNVFGIVIALEYLAFGLAIVYMIAGLRKAAPADRPRYTLMLTAIALTLMARIVSAVINLTNNNFGFSNPLAIAENVFHVTGPVLFAYAVLRHKVLDVGFAVNRALVYGLVSFVLLLGFGLIEWGAEKVIPEAWLSGKIWLDAVIALGIFLTFHRVRDFAEKIVEDLFFRQWRDNEKDLRRFVADAAFVTKPKALTQAFAAELARFCDGAEVALYEPDDGGFARGEGAKGLPGRIDGDDASVVRLRATRGVAEAGERLLLPMMQRSDLNGFVLVGAKPSGDAYRPDERELLAWAAHQVGLDLHALRVEQLEARVGQLEIRNDELQKLVKA